jgi:hypothetical protein
MCLSLIHWACRSPFGTENGFTIGFKYSPSPALCTRNKEERGNIEREVVHPGKRKYNMDFKLILRWILYTSLYCEARCFSWPKSFPRNFQSSPWVPRTWCMAPASMPPVPQVRSHVDSPSLRPRMCTINRTTERGVSNSPAFFVGEASSSLPEVFIGLPKYFSPCRRVIEPTRLVLGRLNSEMPSQPSNLQVKVQVKQPRSWKRKARNL